MTETIEEHKSDQDSSYLNFMPGQRLRRARELRGMSQEQVATELHLSLRYIQAIESDHYVELPEPAFVKGYMRRYAQLVKLSPEDIVAKFEQSLVANQGAVKESQSNPVQILGSMSRQPMVRFRQMRIWLSALVVIAVVAGAFFWNRHETTPTVSPVIDNENGTNKVAVPAPVPVMPSTGAQPLPLPLSAQGAAPALTLAPVTSPAEGNATNTLPLPVTPVASAPQVAVPSAVQGAVPALSPSSAPAAPAATAAPLVASHVQISVQAESWIQIKDADGNIVLSGQFTKGASLEPKGKTPFNLRLGNASGVVVSVDGAAMDLGPYTKNNVATLTVGH